MTYLENSASKRDFLSATVLAEVKIVDERQRSTKMNNISLHGWIMIAIVVGVVVCGSVGALREFLAKRRDRRSFDAWYDQRHRTLSKISHIEPFKGKKLAVTIRTSDGKKTKTESLLEELLIASGATLLKLSEKDEKESRAGTSFLSTTVVATQFSQKVFSYYDAPSLDLEVIEGSNIIGHVTVVEPNPDLLATSAAVEIVDILNRAQIRETSTAA